MTHRRLTQVISAVAMLHLTVATWNGLPTVVPVAPTVIDTASGDPPVRVQHDDRTAAADEVAATPSRNGQQPPPDEVADYAGGIAARLHTADGHPLPGDVFMLMAVAGSDAEARLYDRTPYTHDNGVAADSHESNVTAVAVVETITGADLDLLDLTTAPAGGPSAGIAYAIGYLDVISDGAFTGDLRIAATGRIDHHGYVGPITAVDEKAAAAHLADVDVLFTPSTPTDGRLTTFAARYTGEHHRTSHTGTPLADERKLDNYTAWGATRPDGMDVVHVRHIADVAAYLCGAGSTDACHVMDLLGPTTTEFASSPTDTALHTEHGVLPGAIR